MGGTYGGNAVACAAGIATIAAIEEDGMIANAARQGEKLRGFFSDLQAKYPVIGEVRGLGLMSAVELVEPGSRKPNPAAMKKFVAEAIARKVLTLGCGMYDNVVRFLPALNLSDAELDHALGVYTQAAKAAF